jgi:hypothetical protein
MADRHDLTTLEAVRLQLGLSDGDHADDGWLYDAIATVSAVMETETGRWLAPRTMTRLLDGHACHGGRTIRVPVGIEAVTYLGVSATDQPDDGTGAYTEITRGIHIRGRRQPGDPGTRIELDSTAPALLPWWGYNAVKVTGSWGHAATPPRVREIATIAVVRGFRARQDGSGAPDLAIAGPDGGMRILRRIAPDEMAELRRNWGSAGRSAALSSGIG